MQVTAPGSVFLALLVLFPVAAHGSSHKCVTYKQRQTCGLKGQSVDIPCSYPKDVQDILITGWSKKNVKTMKLERLKQISGYTSQSQRKGDCTLKLTDLNTSYASTYYFRYNIRNGTGHLFTCRGDPGVSLHVFVSAVKIHVETQVGQQNLSAVTVGQRIILTCVPTCPSSLNSTLGYIWYKNQQQLTNKRANTHLLSLDPVSNEDMGSYVCAIMGLEDLRSSAINIRVQKRLTDTTTVKDSVSTPGGDSHSSTDQRFNNDDAPTNKVLLKVSVALVTSVCVGFAIGMSLTLLIFKLRCKDTQKSRASVRSVCKHRDPNDDSYRTLGYSSTLSDYETMHSVKRSSADDIVYENVQLRNLAE